MTDESNCPKCGDPLSVCTLGSHESHRWLCGSYRKTDGEFVQEDICRYECRIRELESENAELRRRLKNAVPQYYH